MYSFSYTYIVIDDDGTSIHSDTVKANRNDFMRAVEDIIALLDDTVDGAFILQSVTANLQIP